MELWKSKDRYVCKYIWVVRRMPSKRRIWERILREYLEDCRDRQLSKSTIKNYRYTLKNLLETLEKGGKNTHPDKIGKQDLAYLLSSLKGTQKTMQHKVAVLKVFLKHHGNTTLDKMGVSYQTDMRPNADWLSPEESEIIKTVCATPVECLIVHLEVDLGLRRVGIMRLTKESINHRSRTVNVLGKGRMGGKERTVPFHRDTENVLTKYYEWRQKMVLQEMSKNSNFEDPDKLLLVKSKGQLKVPTIYMFDGRLREVSKRSGIKFSNHTLRRTYGRNLWKAGVPLETIKELMGHCSIDTTIDYLGIRLDDMTDAMDRLGEYQKSILCPQEGIFEP